LKHGLAAGRGGDAVDDAPVRRLAQAIAGGHKGPLGLFHAEIAAEATLELVRIRELRAVTMGRAEMRRTTPASVPIYDWSSGKDGPPPELLEADAERGRAFALVDDLPSDEELWVAVAALERYERRALSRHRLALRALDALG
jgi:hypothetical protein